MQLLRHEQVLVTYTHLLHIAAPKKYDSLCFIIEWFKV